MIDFSDKEYKQPEDKWYGYKGVKPPERTSHGISEDDIDEVIKSNNDHVCEWRQKGPYIYCISAPFEHGRHIGVFKQLERTGYDGEPILVERRTIYRK